MKLNDALHAFQTEPRQGDLQGAGVRLHYLDWGATGSETLLFLHGGGLNAHTWDVVCDVLSDRYRCVALDLRGHGDSDWSPTGVYPTDDHVADVEAAAAALNLGPFNLIGNSLGGRVALRYAGKRSKDLTGLVLVDFGPRAPGASRRPRSGAGRVRNFINEQTDADSIEEFVDRAIAFNPLRSREQLRRSLTYSLRRTAEGKWTWKYDRRFLDQVPGHDLAQEMATLWDVAGGIACPTLVVRGALSEVFSDDDAVSLAHQLPDADWVRIEGAGHTVQGDQPYALAKGLTEFAGRPRRDGRRQ